MKNICVLLLNIVCTNVMNFCIFHKCVQNTVHLCARFCNLDTGGSRNSAKFSSALPRNSAPP